MLIRLFVIGCIIFALTMAAIYGYRKIAKEHVQHTAKIIAAGVITFLLIAAISILEG
jgi:cell division protein FtsW (lipid II flippase)